MRRSSAGRLARAASRRRSCSDSSAAVSGPRRAGAQALEQDGGGVGAAHVARMRAAPAAVNGAAVERAGSPTRDARFPSAA